MCYYSVKTHGLYLWKTKKGITITNAFQKKMYKLSCEPNKIRVDESSEIYNRSIKSWLQDNDKEMYSTCNEGKFVVAERFIITFKNKIYKYMISVSKKVYIDKLADIINKYKQYIS